MPEPCITYSIRLLAAVVLLISGPLWAHQGHTHQAAVAACQERQRSESCRYEQAGKLYIGSCQPVSDSLMCVRNKPLVRANPEAADKDSPSRGEQNPKP